MSVARESREHSRPKSPSDPREANAMIATKAIPGQRRIHGLGGLKSSPGSARGGQPPESAEPEEGVPGRASRRRRFVAEFSPKRSEAPGAARTAARPEPRGEKRMQPRFRTVPPP